MRDLYNRLSEAPSINPGAKTSSTTGASVDLQGYEGAVVIIAAGAWTDGSHAFSLEESADNATFSTVASGDLQGTLPTIAASGDGNKTYRVGYRGSKRYLRVKSTVTGATSGAVYGASIVRGFPIHTGTTV